VTDFELHSLDASRAQDFFRLQERACGEAWCHCVAWWVPTWEGWGERTESENRALREELFERGEYDGTLLYADGAPVAWCQHGRRDRLLKLREQFGLEPDPDAWAITCFLVHADFRGQGLARRLLAGVLEDLEGRGGSRIEAYPKRGAELDAGDLWNGPEALFLSKGFVVAREDALRPVLVRIISP